MRIISREEFLGLPSGTIFAKFAEQPKDRSHHVLTYGDVAIKGDTGGPDFVVQDLFPAFEGIDDSEQWSEMIIAMIEGKPSPPVDYDCAGRDGLFDDDLFAVWEKQDAQRLIVRLQQAFEEAYGDATDLT